MNRYKKAMDSIALSDAADARITRELLHAAEQRKEKNPMKRYPVKRKFTPMLAAAVLVFAFGVTAYAVGTRILMKVQRSGQSTLIHYDATDDAFIALGTWLPTRLPQGYAVSFVSDAFSGEQNIVYTNQTGSTLRYIYAKAGHFDEAILDHILSEEEVPVNGCAGKLYHQQNSQSLFWTNDLDGIGFCLYSDDLTLSLPEIAQSVAPAETPLQPTYGALVDVALEELGDYRFTVLPAGYTTLAVTGLPTTEGGGWYGYVEKNVANEATNKGILLAYETYQAADGSELTAEEVLALFNTPGTSVTVNGLPGILAKNKASLYWVDTAKHLRFTLIADELRGDALLAVAEGIQ